MKCLVTGAAGFIGSNFIRTLLSKHSEATVINVDKLTYAGNISSLQLNNNKNIDIERVDIIESKKI